MRNYNVNILAGRMTLPSTLVAAAMLLLAGCANAPPAADAEASTDATQQISVAGSAQPAANAQRYELIAQSQPPQPVTKAPPHKVNLRYVVKKGDTLWDIASYFLDNPLNWPNIWYVNSDIPNPHLIYPGDILHLVNVNGRPQLRAIKRLSPQIRSEPLQSSIPTIPLAAIRQFLHNPRLVTSQQLDSAPYILQFLDKHLLGATGNTTYVRKAQAGNGNIYSVVHPGPPYHDPVTGELLGYKAIPVGTIRIDSFDDISTGVLTDTTREVRVGDRLLPLDEESLAYGFHPHAPSQPVDALIISVYGNTPAIGQYQIVTLNRGSNAGLGRGAVLDVYQPGAATIDPVTGEKLQLPSVKAGTLMIFKVEDRVSYGLVMQSTRAIHLLDRARSPAN